MRIRFDRQCFVINDGERSNLGPLTTREIFGSKPDTPEIRVGGQFLFESVSFPVYFFGDWGGEEISVITELERKKAEGVNSGIPIEYDRRAFNGVVHR